MIPSVSAMTALWHPVVQTGMMLAEAHGVIGLRLLGMAGLWPVDKSEGAQMLGEKGPAWFASVLAGQQAMLRLADPAEVSLAMVRPLRRETSANLERLSRRLVD